jgi:murein L,D-transpeptidase YafK
MVFVDPIAAAGVDRIVVEKSARKLTLIENGAVIRSYRVALGANPLGHKQREGDERTPEGEYVIDYRNDDSSFYRSLHISYPNEVDRQRAAEHGVEPGGDIMIHGLPDEWGWLGSIHHALDWTDGCIAVTNWEMDEIWSLVEEGTPIEIVP